MKKCKKQKRFPRHFVRNTEHGTNKKIYFPLFYATGLLSFVDHIGPRQFWLGLMLVVLYSKCLSTIQWSEDRILWKALYYTVL